MTKRDWGKHLMLLAAGALLAAMSPAEQSAVERFATLNAASRAAREARDHAAYLKHVRELLVMAPGNPNLHFHLARALALRGDAAGMIAQLERLAAFGLFFPVATDAAFDGFREDSRFAAASSRVTANGAGTGRGKGIVKLGLTAGSEGVAWSEPLGAFLMGSGGSIHAYKLGAEGSAKPIARAFSPQVLGIRPDPDSRSYLVCTNREGGEAAAVRHHQWNGAIMGIYKLPAKNALCNDIAMLKNGSFAVTDSNNHVALHLVDGRLAPLPLPKPAFYANGIASDLQRDRLYIAHSRGITVYHTPSRASTELDAPGALIGGIDGMVWHKGSLIGVQNSGGANRLLKVTPDAAGKTAKVEVLAGGRDFPGGASTVAVVGDDAFVIGQSAAEGADGRRGEPILIRVALRT